MWNLGVEGFLESKESKKIVGKELSSGSVEKRQLLLLSINKFVLKWSQFLHHTCPNSSTSTSYLSRAFSAAAL